MNSHKGRYRRPLQQFQRRQEWSMSRHRNWVDPGFKSAARCALRQAALPCCKRASSSHLFHGNRQCEFGREWGWEWRLQEGYRCELVLCSERKKWGRQETVGFRAFIEKNDVHQRPTRMQLRPETADILLSVRNRKANNRRPAIPRSFAVNSQTPSLRLTPRVCENANLS